MVTVLTEAQHASLDRYAERRPDAKVVGWDQDLMGPIIRTGGGKLWTCKYDGRMKNLALDLAKRRLEGATLGLRGLR